MKAKQMCGGCGYYFVPRGDDGLMRIHQVPLAEKSGRYKRCSGSLLPPIAPEEAPPQPFEYLTVINDCFLSSEELNEHGDKGWEMCGVIKDLNRYIYYLKRPRLTPDID